MIMLYFHGGQRTVKTAGLEASETLVKGEDVLFQ